MPSVSETLNKPINRSPPPCLPCPLSTPPRTHPPCVLKAFYSAHPSTDTATGETFNIGIGGEKGAVEVSRLFPNGTLDKSVSFVPPTSTFWHDNTITEEYVVAVTSPYVAPLKKVLFSFLGFGQLGGAFNWDDSLKSEVL